MIACYVRSWVMMMSSLVREYMYACINVNTRLLHLAIVNSNLVLHTCINIYIYYVHDCISY